MVDLEGWILSPRQGMQDFTTHQGSVKVGSSPGSPKQLGHTPNEIVAPFTSRLVFSEGYMVFSKDVDMPINLFPFLGVTQMV